MEEGFERAGSPKDAIVKLQDRGCSEATLAGGSILNSSFAKEGLIDEVKINIEAVMIGKGVPLFAPGDFDVKLQLKSITQLNDKVVQFHYGVIKS